MSKLMYFKGPLVYSNNIAIGLSSILFLLYGLIRSKDFVGFYKKKFYIVFMFHCYAIILNGIHGLVVKHEVVHTTLFTELCLFLTLFCFLCVTMYWTYQYYLKFIYSLVTRRYFKPLTNIIRSWFTCLVKSKDYYEYDTITPYELEGEEEQPPAYEEEHKCLITEDGLFRYMNYQILGNYLCNQLFTLYILACTFLIRSLSMHRNIIAPTQLVMLNIIVFVFQVGIGIIDYKYRRFTKSLILPHLTVLVFLGHWMFEFYVNFDNVEPEPVSTTHFALTFIYVVVKFAFLIDSSFVESINESVKPKYH